MESEKRDPRSDLIDEINSGGARFFQAVRRLNRLARSRRGGQGHVAGHRASEETVHFKAQTGMGHPAQEVVSCRERSDGQPPEMVVSFMGLTGPSGVAPDFYTEFLVAQDAARNAAAGDFLDLFNHRLVALFYRVWARTRMAVRVEEAAKPLSDPFAVAIAAASGLGLQAARPLLDADGGDLLGVAGHLNGRPCSTGRLQRMLEGLYKVPVRIDEFEERWIEIPESDQTRLSGAPGGAAYNQLGVTAISGARRMDVQSSFTVRMGPLGIDDFRMYLDDDALAASLRKVIRLAVGCGMSFNLRLVLRREEVPRPVIDRSGSAMRLGYTSWLVSEVPARDLDQTKIALSRRSPAP